MNPWDWTVRYEPGETTRTVMWNGKEVANVNPRGDFDEETEAQLAAGLAFAARMHRCLKMIAVDEKTTPDTMKEITDILHGVNTIDVGTYTEPPEDEGCEYPHVRND